MRAQRRSPARRRWPLGPLLIAYCVLILIGRARGHNIVELKEQCDAALARANPPLSALEPCTQAFHGCTGEQFPFRQQSSGPIVLAEPAPGSRSLLSLNWRRGVFHVPGSLSLALAPKPRPCAARCCLHVRTHP